MIKKKNGFNQLELKLEKEFWKQLKSNDFKDITIESIFEASGIDNNKSIKIRGSINEILYSSLFRMEKQILEVNYNDFSNELNSDFHDKLLEALILRFENFIPLKNQIIKIYNESKINPKLAGMLGIYLYSTINQILNICGDQSKGLLRTIRVKGLIFTVLKVKKTWIDDETKDLSYTISKLDDELNRAKEVFETFFNFKK